MMHKHKPQTNNDGFALPHVNNVYTTNGIVNSAVKHDISTTSI